MKIGVLGGGQLGRMFLQQAYNYPYTYFIMDPSDNAPCKSVCDNVVKGDFSNYDDVLRFGSEMDVIGIEIEHVNTEALKSLEKLGKKVIPSANTIEIIKDKGLQKQFYEKNSISSPNYYLINNISEIDTTKIDFPFVQKLRTGGYDGKGVQVIKNTDGLSELWNEPSVIEKFTNISKEIAVMVVIGENGETVAYPTVEMVFDHNLNLVDYVFSPAELSDDLEKKCVELAEKVAKSFDSKGIFAVELFLDNNNDVWVNETAPRVHNSGHHTIEASYSSQFDQMCRLYCGLSLGNPELRESGAMINIVGAENNNGKAKVEGITELSSMHKVYMHWYGKEMTTPGRKMGHITIVGNKQYIEKSIKLIKQTVKVISED